MERYYTATSVADAHRALREAKDAAVIAGGQELMLDMRKGERNPEILIDISSIDELREITHTSDAVHVGACVPYRDLETNSILQSRLPVVVTVVEGIAGLQVRNNGPLGGALWDADPVFDLPAVLLTLDADVTADARGDRRQIPLSQFYTGHRETVLGPRELLTSIRIPKPPDGSAGTYRSMTQREGDSTVAGVAVRLETDDSGVCRTARIGLTNAGEVPRRARAAEDELEGAPVTGARIQAAAGELHSNLDLREYPGWSRSYRTTVFERLTARALRDVRSVEAGEAT
jgi:CO/xanthine dehydrogenase FAD-binding subunit